jgi:lipopolysaccharide/colanic/teichoic acid biosynthesis glycosyltransferase
MILLKRHTAGALRAGTLGTAWVVAGPESDAVAELIRSSGRAAAAVGNLDVALQRAERGDWIVLSSPVARDLVEGADRSLSRGWGVVLDARSRQPLRRAFGQIWHGLPAVVLPPRAESRANQVASRARDVFASGAALVALSPILAVLAALVKRSSPGPVLFRTRVVGRDGKVFVWSKLRSMRVAGPEAEERRRREVEAFMRTGRVGTSGQQQSVKIVDQSRVTGIGRFLRRHSLDELPQLWNVLRGDMSLVGPRPWQPYEYELLAPWQRWRNRVTPGLTGPWQVFGRSRLSMDETVLLDYCYACKRNFWLDLRLIGLTFSVVLTGSGGG